MAGALFRGALAARLHQAAPVVQLGWAASSSTLPVIPAPIAQMQLIGKRLWTAAARSSAGSSSLLTAAAVRQDTGSLASCAKLLAAQSPCKTATARGIASLAYKSSGAPASVAAKAAAGRKTRSYAQQFWDRNYRYRSRGLNPEHVLYGLIGCNAAGFLLWRVSPEFMTRNATLSISNLKSGRLWTMLTSSFSHMALMHLGGNMLTLYFFGQGVGRMFGGRTLLALYLSGALVGSTAHLAWHYLQACAKGSSKRLRDAWFRLTPPTIGASASVNALVMASILLNPRQTYYLYMVIPAPAWLLGTLWLVADISGAVQGGGHIAHVQHLGGALAGLMFFIGFRTGRIRPW